MVRPGNLWRDWKSKKKTRRWLFQILPEDPDDSSQDTWHTGLNKTSWNYDLNEGNEYNLYVIGKGTTKFTLLHIIDLIHFQIFIHTNTDSIKIALILQEINNIIVIIVANILSKLVIPIYVFHVYLVQRTLNYKRFYGKGVNLSDI